MDDLDFSVAAMYDLDQHNVVVMTPVTDQYGTVYMSVEEAARRTGVSRKVIEEQLRSQCRVPARGMLFNFVA